MANWTNKRRSIARRLLPALVVALPAAAALLGAETVRENTMFLDRELGARAPGAPLVRRPAPGVRVTLRADGYGVQHRGEAVSLATDLAGNWQRFANGVARPTSFGRETILVDERTTEQFLTVEQRQGVHRWTWRLHTGGLTPRVEPDGSIGFHDGAVASLAIKPARILDAARKDVTPAGVRWTLGRDRDGWSLALALDDAELPLPYVIDPAITLRSAATSANNGGGAGSLTINRPGSVVAGDFLLALVNARGGTSRAIFPPAGWTLVRRDNNGTQVAQAVYRKVVTAAEPLSYTWTFNASVKATGGMLPYVGVNSVAPIDASSLGVNVAGSSSATAPSVTTTAPNHRVVGFFGIDDDRTWSPPAGMTERWDSRAGNGAGSISSEAADMTAAAAGATGSKTAIASGGGFWVAQLVALRVDAVPPPSPVHAISEASPDSHVVGSSFYYRPAGAGGTFTVTTTAADPESGVAMVTFPGLGAGFVPTTSTNDFSAPYSLTYSWTSGASESGAKTVTVTDHAGNTSGGDFTLEPDSVPPVTTDDTAAIGSTWRSDDATVTLDASDAGSGVAATYYTTDGSGPTTASPQGTSVLVSGEGVHTVKYFSKDNVGNAEAVQTAGTQIRIDTTAPTTATLDPLPPTISEPQALTGSGTDALSGVASIGYFYCAGPPCAPTTFIGESSVGPSYSFAWDDQPPDGNYAVIARVYDAAGNTLDSSARTITIDNAPDTTIESGPVDPTNSASATFAFSANESPVIFTCQLDGGSAAPCLSPVSYTGLADGAHVFQVYATDALGNVGTAATYPWIIDRGPPNTAIDSGPSDPTNATAATFTFSASELGSTFECRVDGGTFSPCASPTLYTGLSGGTHTFEVRATDAAGNLDTTPAAYTWSIDVTPPSTTVDSGPADPTNATSATFAFSADEPGSTFECQLDGGGYSACTTPKTYTGLAAGAHTFDVRAIDPVGNTGTAASDSWTIDLTAPETAVTSGPANPSGATSASFSFTADEPGSTFQCQVDGGGFASCTSPKTYTGLGAGSHTFQVRATDPAGNTDPTPASQTWTIDLAPPTATIDSGPPNPTNATAAAFTFSSSEPGSSFECQLDGGAYAACTSPKTYIGLAAGTHTFRVRAIDGVGNRGSDATATWVIDLTSPSVTIGAGPASPTSATSATFAFSADEPGASFECRLDGGGFSPCTSPKTYSSLTAGTHAFDVRATDAAGNTGSTTSASWTIDVTPPDTTIGSGPSDPSGSGSATFVFSASEPGSTFACQLDGGGYAACTSPKTYSGLGAGSHTFQVRATDAAGNTDGTPASLTWTIDVGPPTATIDSGPADPTGSTAATFTFSSSEPGSTFECQLDAGAYAACTTPKSYTGLADGVHTFRVRAIDAVGNVSAAAVHSWRIDATAPTASVDSRPDALTNATVATFAFSASEAGSSFQCQLDGGAYAACTSPRSYTALAEGSHTFRVRPTDALGNAGSAAAVSWTVDTTPPTASLADPGANLSRIVTLSAGASDANGVASVRFERSPSGASTWTTVDTDGTAPYSAELVTNAVIDGFYDVRAIAADAAGNTAASPVLTRRIDNTAPTASIAAAHVFARVPVDVTATGTDEGSGVASVTFERAPRGSGAWTAFATVTAEPYTATFNPAGLADGPYDLRAVVADAAGNAARVRTSIYVATSPLAVALGDPGPVLTGTALLFATTSGAGAQQVTFEVKRSAASAWMLVAVDTAPPWSVSFDTPALRDGVYDVRATTVDADGVSASDARTGVVIDNTAPALVSSTPADGGTTGPAATVTVTASEPLASVSDVTLDGGSAKTPAIAGTKATFTLGNLAPGSHTLAGRLHDNAGLAGSFTLRFRVVESALTARLAKPTRKAATVTVAVTVSKPATLAGRLLAPNGRAVATRQVSAPKGTTRLAFRLPRTARSGRYTIVVRASTKTQTVTKRVAFSLQRGRGGSRGTWVVVRR